MSRSYRKPYNTDRWRIATSKRRINPAKLAKREAARKVRKVFDLPDGGAYKKLYDRYDIWEYSFYDPEDPKVWRK